jgi:hypothetical protein
MRHEAQHPQQEQQRFQRVERHDEDQLPELFDTNTTADFQEQWLTIQSCFVDDPRSAVAQANALVDDMINRIVQSFDRARQNLETQWEGQGEPSTEDLRKTLMRYRSFFHRLLSTYAPEG